MGNECKPLNLLNKLTDYNSTSLVIKVIEGSRGNCLQNFCRYFPPKRIGEKYRRETFSILCGDYGDNFIRCYDKEQSSGEPLNLFLLSKNLWISIQNMSVLIRMQLMGLLLLLKKLFLGICWTFTNDYFGVGSKKGREIIQGFMLVFVWQQLQR